MRPIPTSFTRSGWHHEQIDRKGDVAIYKRWKDTSAKPHYETIIILSYKERTTKEGVTYPASEYYPGDEEFGRKAWTFPTEEQARIKYQELSTPKGPKKLKKPTKS